MWVKGHFIPKRLANAYAWLSIIFLVLTLLAILFTHIFPHFAHHHNVVVLNADYAITPHVPTSPILSLPKDSLYINSDNVYTLRQAGFSYYQISHIMQLRSRGFVFNSITDLDAIPYADSALLAPLQTHISFRTLSNQFQTPYHSYQSHPNFAPRYANNNTHRRRVPLFLADSAELISNGLSPIAWDTLSHYQRNFILTGSADFDSLTTLTPSAIATLCRNHISKPRHSPILNSLKSPKSTSPSTPTTIPQVELNSANAQQLEALPHIGPASAHAIIQHRQDLGGFVSPLQLSEIYQLKDSYQQVAQYFVIDTTLVQPINVNSQNDTRMRRHPYFSRLIVNRLWQIRVQHGTNYRLTPADVNQAIAFQDVSPFFWYYVSY